MRGLILVCAVLIGVYCADRAFYSGAHTSAAGYMLSRIGHSFR
jgi:hypothetical protein